MNILNCLLPIFTTFNKKSKESWAEYGHRVSYLESYGSEYISLPYQPNDKTQLIAKFKINAYTKDACPLYGSRSSYNDNGFSFFHYTLYSYNFFTGFGGATVQIHTSIQQQLNMTLNIIHNRNGFTLNNVLINSSHFRNFTKPINDLVIFSIRTLNTVDIRKARAQLHEYLIMEDDVPIHNLIFIKTDKKAYGSYPKGAYLPWDTITNSVPYVYGLLGGGDAI